MGEKSATAKVTKAPSLTLKGHEEVFFIPIHYFCFRMREHLVELCEGQVEKTWWCVTNEDEHTARECSQIFTDTRKLKKKYIWEQEWLKKNDKSIILLMSGMMEWCKFSLLIGLDTHTDTDQHFCAFPLDSVVWYGMGTNPNSELSASWLSTGVHLL